MSWALRMTLRVFPILLIIYFYTGWRLAASVSCIFGTPKLLSRSAVLLIIFFLNLLPLILIFKFATGSINQTYLFRTHLVWQDYVFTFPFWWGLVLAIAILPYFLGLDVFALLFKWTHLFKNVNWKTYLAQLRLIVLGFFVIYVSVRIYRDTYRVRVSQQEVRLLNLPKELEGLSFTLIADVQVDRYTQSAKLNRFRAAYRKANGDITLFAGDLVTSGQHFIGQGIDLLCNLNAPLKRIACMGDHDYWANPSAISGGLRKCGWVFLQNEHYMLPYKNKRILITVITNIYSQHISERNLAQLLRNAPPADLKILLVHQPSPYILNAASKYGYDLLTAGHTHGGQLRFRPFGFSITPSQFENPIYSGLHRWKNMWVAVTNGVGLTLAPLRYQAPAEITKLVLVAEPR